jgi:hypothetical protein
MNERINIWAATELKPAVDEDWRPSANKEITKNT